MSKYLLVYHGGSMPESEAEQAKVMDAWSAWFGELGPALVDGGNPVAATKTIAPGGKVSEGGSNPASGYSLIEARNLDEAVRAAKGCPVLASGGSIEVAETFNAM